MPDVRRAEDGPPLSDFKGSQQVAHAGFFGGEFFLIRILGGATAANAEMLTCRLFSQHRSHPIKRFLDTNAFRIMGDNMNWKRIWSGALISASIFFIFDYFFTTKILY